MSFSAWKKAVVVTLGLLKDLSRDDLTDSLGGGAVRKMGKMRAIAWPP